MCDRHFGDIDTSCQPSTFGNILFSGLKEIYSFSSWAGIGTILAGCLNAFGILASSQIFLATRDDGRPLGSKSQSEGKIFLNAQTWSIIHGTATPERAKQCMAACEKHLFRQFGPLLLTPAYTRTDPTIGYITRYAPAVRENGGVYSHAATWAVQALAIMGEGDRAHQLYQKSWNGFKVKRFFRGTTYEITVQNPKHVSTGVKKITVDGKPIAGNMIKPLNRKISHQVNVVMG